MLCVALMWAIPADGQSISSLLTPWPFRIHGMVEHQQPETGRGGRKGEPRWPAPVFLVHIES
jgi:hypothetical protein